MLRCTHHLNGSPASTDAPIEMRFSAIGLF